MAGPSGGGVKQGTPKPRDNRGHGPPPSTKKVPSPPAPIPSPGMAKDRFLKADPHALLALGSVLLKQTGPLRVAVGPLTNIALKPGNFTQATQLINLVGGKFSVAGGLANTYHVNLLSMVDALDKLASGLKKLAEDYAKTEDLNKINANDVQAAMAGALNLLVPDGNVSSDVPNYAPPPDKKKKDKPKKT